MLEHFRKDAKRLIRAFNAGDRAAVARAEAVPGERARTRFQLSDAQYVVAVEHGFRSWAQLRKAALHESPERTERLVEAGSAYLPGEPVRIRLVRRGRRTSIDDLGAAVALAGPPPAWRELAERIVEDYSININRRGVISVPIVGDRDPAPLVRRVADCSLAVFQELLELEG